jgi:hypothetical protein
MAAVGGLQDAWALLQAGQIEPGRELLLQVCAREPSNVDAHALGVIEFYREPRRWSCWRPCARATS